MTTKRKSWRSLARQAKAAEDAGKKQLAGRLRAQSARLRKATGAALDEKMAQADRRWRLIDDKTVSGMNGDQVAAAKRAQRQEAGTLHMKKTNVDRAEEQSPIAMEAHDRGFRDGLLEAQRRTDKALLADFLAECTFGRRSIGHDDFMWSIPPTMRRAIERALSDLRSTF